VQRDSSCGLWTALATHLWCLTGGKSQPCIVTGHEQVGSMSCCPVTQGAKLDVAVTGQVRVWGEPLRQAVEERFEDLERGGNGGEGCKSCRDQHHAWIIGCISDCLQCNQCLVLVCNIHDGILLRHVRVLEFKRGFTSTNVPPSSVPV